jgi:small subunit ribosomal protein S17
VADEEKNENVEETPAPEAEAPVEETPAPEVEEAPAEENAADAAPSDDAPSDDAASDDVAEPAEPQEQLSPTERRRRRRSGKNRRPKFTGTPEERSVQRAAYRKKKAAQRSKYRIEQRAAHKAAGPREGTPPTVKEPGSKKIQQGTVVSSKTDKTITIEIEVMEAHRMYKKIVRHTKKLTAHDAANDANEGDVVRVIESRPLSKTKRWRLVEVVERAR